MNNIKKVILSMDKSQKTNSFDNLKEIIVIRDNSVDRYTSDLKAKYVTIVKELFEQYKNELKDLKINEAINKLGNDLNIINYNREDIIKKMIIYIDDKDIVKYKAIYNGHEEELSVDECFDPDDFANKVSEKGKEFARIYGIESLSELKKLGLIEAEELNKKLNETMKENKIKNLIVNHKTVSGILAGAIAIVGIWGGAKLLSKHNNEENSSTQIEFFNEQPSIPPLYTELEEIPTIEPTMIPKEIAIKSENKIFPNYEEPNNNRIIVKKINGDNYYLEDNLSFDILFENYRNPNMSSVGNNVQSNISKEDSGAFIYFENKFNDNLIDKAYVKYFSMLGNEIIRNAYLENNMGISYGVDYYVRQSGVDVVRLIRDNKPLVVYINGEKQKIRFDELSVEAKEVVLQIAIANNCPTYKDTIEYNNEIINQDDISNIIINKWNELEYSKSR